jgi:hypothetical protein
MARRSSFPIVAASILALLHLYIGLRLLPPLPAAAAWGGGALLIALFALVLSSASPIFGRPPSSALLTWAGLTAMGFFSSLLVLTVLRDAALLLGLLVGLHERFALATAWAVPALALLATLLGFANARRRPAVREVDVPIAGLPPAWVGFSIVQISDLHVGPTIKRGFVQRVVDRANSLQPDLMVITGDVVDGTVAELREHTQPLSRLSAQHGVYAVTGNHEYYSGAHGWIDEFNRIGMTVLMNEHVLLRRDGADLLLAGVTDFSAHHFDASHRSDPARALRGAPARAMPKVLLAHQPRSAPAAAAAGFDLQLSGHTHGGQFLPWNWLVPLQQPYTAGLHRHGALWVYISRGTGYWGPPKRLGAPSEITRLRLVAATQAP